MTTHALEGRILTPSGFVQGALEVAQGRVVRVTGQPVSAQSVRDSAQPIILPGFIDLHVHGAGGVDIMEGGNAAEQVARTHVRTGTTSLLATTMTAPLEEITHAIAAVEPLIAQPGKDAARVLGIHLEGPYINPGKLGAQPAFARPNSLEEIQQLHTHAPIRLVTVAPELEGGIELIVALRAAGFVVQIGHTLGSYEDGVAALAAGANGFTHLFNAMSGLHHRAPGIVGAALAHAQYAEMIADLQHVHPGAIKAALRAIPHLYCVTDSTAATGMPDGEYALGRHRVRKCGNGVRLADGTLAGSTLTMDAALRNLVQLDLPLDDAARRVSTYAAQFLGLTDRGQLTPGAFADVVVMNHDLRVEQVMVEGQWVDLGR
ncbi:MAG: N-acetylglucosamine-6-phosphate deacetylase [Burkholderiaceae bacterium]